MFAFILFIIFWLIDYTLYYFSNMHIFQLNFYNEKVQLKYIYKNLKKSLLSIFYYISIITLFVILDGGIYYACALYLGMCFYHLPKKAKKPLVYTSRVKITYVLSLLLLTCLFLAFMSNRNTLIIAFTIISALTPIILILSNYMYKPIGLMIDKKYEKKAINKLNDLKDLIVIGVTGSYGKTSMKNYLYEILSTKYNCYKTPGNINTKKGIIKDINNNLSAKTQIYICEMGADHVNDIKDSASLVKPKYGIITSIGYQHLETFKTIENIINTKFELYDEVKNNNGKMFLNFDNEFIKTKDIQKDIKYSCENKHSDFYAYDIKVSEKGTSFKVKDNLGKEYAYNTKILGNHNILNITGALSIASALNVDLSSLNRVISNLTNVSHRLEVSRNAYGIIIDDAYNSNPVGALNALKTLNEFNGFKIVVTPGMVELGEKEEEFNVTFGEQCAKYADYIILVGRKRAKIMMQGIKQTKFELKKVIVVDKIEEAFNDIRKLNTNKEKIILLENDLPDQY